MKRFGMAMLVCAIVACTSLLLAGCEAKTYTPPAKNQTVSASALGKAGVLRVGVNSASAPLAGQATSSSRIVGIDVDVASYLADQLGCKVEIVDVGNDPATALANGMVDVVLGVEVTDDEVQYWRSPTYIQTGVALFGTESETAVPTVDSAPQIAAQASSKSSWRVTNLYGDASLVAQDDLKSAFASVEQGAVRYVAADAVIGTYVAHTNGYGEKIVALLSEHGAPDGVDERDGHARQRRHDKRDRIQVAGQAPQAQRCDRRQERDRFRCSLQQRRSRQSCRSLQQRCICQCCRGFQQRCGCK